MTQPHEFLTLFRATPAQVLESRQRTWPEWGGVLTEEQYLERDNQMPLQEMIPILLIPRVLVKPKGTRSIQQFKSSAGGHLLRCSLYVHPTPQTKKGGAPPQAPEAEEAGNGLFSILYSAREARQPISTIWEIPEQREVGQDDTDNKWIRLKYEDLDAFWAKDVQLIRRTMENLPESNSDYHTERPTAFVTCLPDDSEGVGTFHIFCSMFAVNGIVSMTAWGIEKKGGHPDQPTYATWTVDTKPLPRCLSSQG
ncbi:hypothetical protein OG21DRAFT_1487859 [Imleria badia]|nr:hypothetical protein OG21DRAFT_1487859 [Imleria badia]